VNAGWLSNWEIYLMNADGSGQINLSKHFAFDRNARWSPSGAQVAFVSTRDGNREIYRVNADGSSSVNLTQNSQDDDDPSWSPDGQKIAFERYNPDPPVCCYVTVYTMNADGSAQVLLNGALEDANDPRWSPSGSRLLVLEQGDVKLTVLNADGSGPTVIQNNVNGLGDAVWSPDGKRVAYWGWDPWDNGNDDVQGIRTVGADGGFKQFVTNHLHGTGIRDRSPVWRP
jgi:Tol biopolymer transport system component